MKLLNEGAHELPGVHCHVPNRAHVLCCDGMHLSQHSMLPVPEQLHAAEGSDSGGSTGAVAPQQQLATVERQLAQSMDVLAEVCQAIVNFASTHVYRELFAIAPPDKVIGPRTDFLTGFRPSSGVVGSHACLPSATPLCRHEVC
jgi:hypothetical protein